MAAAAGNVVRLPLRRLGVLATAGGVAALGGTAYYYRPHPDTEGDGSTPRPPWSSPEQLCDRADEPESLLMRATRTVTIGLVAAASRLSLMTLNDFSVRQDKRHARLVDLVLERPDGVPLITVSNHTTTLDDPTLFGVMMPWTVNLRPEKVRWTACTQDICFKSDALAAFFGAGKVMPIHRGAGIDQKLLLDLGRRVAAGDWVHVFPEGKCFQIGQLGGRSGPEAEQLGRLKWGVGKLIARSPKRPIVIPIYHIGMEAWFPINQETKTLESWWPGRGKPLSLVVGDPIPLDDLLDEYERYAAGKKTSPRARTPDAALNVRLEKWESDKKEREIYNRIMHRIEGALLELEKEAEQYHAQTFGDVRGRKDISAVQQER